MPSYSETGGERVGFPPLTRRRFFQSPAHFLSGRVRSSRSYRRAVVSSMMRHGATSPRPPLQDLLANIGIFFHFPSILIVLPFGLLIFAPLVQIALMTTLLCLILRARGDKRKPPLTILT